MQNFINWFEIPASDIKRAVKFYQEILQIEITETEMMGMKMGFLPNDGKIVSGAIVQGEDYSPRTDGTLVYLNGGDDLDLPLKRIEPAGGKVLVQKTQISPEIGFFAMFIDPEGNKVALHSIN
jgi:hypothetical protein